VAYVPHTAEDIREMLERIGASSLEDLFRSIPEELRRRTPLSIPECRTEAEILRDMEKLAGRNRRIDDRPSFLGAGVYHRFIPSAVDYLSSRGEFNTAYTPYQPEASQGTLQAIFEYQTMIARLTGMEIANASMYEGATALAEGLLMAYAVHQKGTRALVSGGLHPEYRRVLETYFRHHPIQVETLPLGPQGTLVPEELAERIRAAGDVFAVAIQNPSFFGSIEDGQALSAALGAASGAASGGARPLLIVSAEPISLALLAPPGSYGADVALGDGQGLGNEPSYGGPTFGFFATRLAHVRKVPGRIVGETRDREGRRGYVLTFQTREQHIRRERATSNICTNQGLCCLRGAMYLALLGESGLRLVAERSTRMAHLAFERLTRIPGVRQLFAAPFFQEFTLGLPRPALEVYRALGARGIVGGLPLSRFFPERGGEMLFACTEMTQVEDIERLASALAEVLSSRPGEPRAEGRDSLQTAAAAPRRLRP
jgi:glycine dehydrogenase subunit 1